MKEKLKEYLYRIRKNCFNFKLTMVNISILTVSTVLLTSAVFSDVSWSSQLYDYTGIFYTFLWLSGLGTLFFETLFLNRKKQKIIGCLLAVVFSLPLAFLGCASNHDTMMKFLERFGNPLNILPFCYRLITGYVILSLIFILYFSYRNSEMPFKKYVLTVFSRLFMTLIIYNILMFGAFIISIVFMVLIHDSVSLLDNLLILLTGFYLIPSVINAMEAKEKEPFSWMEVIVRYILVILTVLITVIVYVYAFKILITKEMPSNAVFGIVSGLFCIGMPVWLMADYYYSGNLFSKFTAKMPYFFAPLLILQSYSMGLRIYEYGLTPSRCVGVLLILTEICFVLIWRIRREKCEWLLLLIASFAVFALFMPFFNIYHLSELSQRHALKKYYQSASEGTELSWQEYTRMKGAYEYLKETPGNQEFTKQYDIEAEDFEVAYTAREEENQTEDERENYSYERGHGCQLVGKLDVSDYTSFYMLNQNECYDDYTYNFEEEEGISVDFSNFKFVKRETGEEIVIDIEKFADASIRHCKQNSSESEEQLRTFMQGINKIVIDENTVFYINHFQFSYKEYEDGRIVWNSINISGMLLEK